MVTIRHAAQAGRQVIDYLTSLQVSQLKHIAVNTGLSTGPNKAVTAESLYAGLYNNKHHGLTRKTIYKSVDMGVKNLAFSVIEPPGVGSSTSHRLLDWQRLNVLTADKASLEDATSTVEQETEPDDADVTSSATTSLFNPSNLAPAAARLANRLANDLKPTTILIERQRYRSGRGAAVQEWTLRVNSLEAMLWASLETMRVHRLASPVDTFFPLVVEMSPQRIAAFWNARGKDWSLMSDEPDYLVSVDGHKAKKKSTDADEGAKRGMEKAEKIALVRNWFENGDVDVKADIQPLANAFMQTGRARRAGGDLVVGKKDDLADCVVQGVTFGLWERNREVVRGHLDKMLA